MRKPRRFQRSRRRGWRMPASAIYVGRPTEWGNPLVGSIAAQWFRVWLYEAIMGNPVTLADILAAAGPIDRSYAVPLRLAKDAQLDMTAAAIAGNLLELRGKDLVCWCPLDVRCHADVYLELANLPLSDLRPLTTDH